MIPMIKINRKRAEAIPATVAGLLKTKAETLWLPTYESSLNSLATKFCKILNILCYIPH